MKRKKRICEECGEDIIDRRKNAIYCKECAVKKRKEYRKAYTKEYAKKHREQYREASKRASYKKSYIINFIKKKYGLSISEIYDKLKKGELK